jgi:two-component system NtrC family sensor kinase
LIPIQPGDSPDAIVRAILGVESASSGSASAPTGSPTVLLLDDRGIARKNLAGQLGSEGWRVLEAADPKEATLKLLDQRVDCFLVNSVLAGQPSGGVIKSAIVVRDVHPHPFSIVALVDVDEGNAASAVMKLGVDDVVAKSAAASVLARRMSIAVRTRDLRREIRALKERIAALEKTSTPDTHRSG